MSNNINFDKSFFRTIILSTLGTIRNTLELEVNDTKNITLYKVPIFFSLTGDERYLQDKYLNWMTPECQRDCQKAEGNYDPIPRGALMFDNLSILKDRLTNPNIRMNYTKKSKKEIAEYSSRIHWIPLKVDFNIEFIVDNTIDLFLIIEQILEKWYKYLNFTTQWKGFNINSSLQFPEETNIDKLLEFSSGDDNKRNKITIPLELETYMPIVNKEQEFFSGNTMDKITLTSDFSDNNILLKNNRYNSIVEKGEDPKDHI